MTAVAENVVRRVQARAEAAVVRNLIAAGVGGVVLVITNAGAEAPVLVQVPAIVDERRLCCQIALVVLKNEDRRPDEVRSGAAGPRRDRRVDLIANALRAVDEEAV